MGPQRVLEGHSTPLGSRALEALWQSKGTWSPEHSRHLGTQALEHPGTRRTLGHLGSQALEALYLPDFVAYSKVQQSPKEPMDIYQNLQKNTF